MLAVTVFAATSCGIKSVTPYKLAKLIKFGVKLTKFTVDRTANARRCHSSIKLIAEVSTLVTCAKSTTVGRVLSKVNEVSNKLLALLKTTSPLIRQYCPCCMIFAKIYAFIKLCSDLLLKD